VFVLEGGYDLGALRKSVQSVLETIQTGVPEALHTRCRGMNAAWPPLFDQIEDARLTLRPYWDCL
jgi:acetoin utilization deacetylase AcuC-like enzyme